MTEEIVRCRLDVMEKLQTEFESQRRSITDATHNQQDTSLRKHDYFTDDQFDRAEESYLEQKGLILDIFIECARGTSRTGHRGHAVEVTGCFVSNSTSNVRQSLQ